MDAVMMRLSETVSDDRGTFHALAMARERNDGSWEGWLEFVSADNDSCRYVTPIETRQHDRVTMERWASGLTVVYADGALARARTPHTATAESDQLLALQELIEALDRRVPHVERAGGHDVAMALEGERSPGFLGGPIGSDHGAGAREIGLDRTVAGQVLEIVLIDDPVVDLVAALAQQTRHHVLARGFLAACARDRREGDRGR